MLASNPQIETSHLTPKCSLPYRYMPTQIQLLTQIDWSSVFANNIAQGSRVACGAITQVLLHLAE